MPSEAYSWNVDAVRDDGAIERENVALTTEARSTYAVPSAGVTDVTFGPSTVVKPHEVAANGVPSAALIVPASCAVYVVDGVSGTAGVNVAVADGASYETVPGTEPAALVSVNEAVVRVFGSMPRENVAVAVVAVETEPEPAAGVNAVNVGGAGATAATVNDHTYALAIGTPSVLVIVAPSRAVYVPASARATDGRSVAWRVVES